ncbi:hypothetical protein [Brachybacterium sp. Z12]|uniref:hypothetical protein n=1 Tax=Brachybacterium sp. Z12 TaxID=2759167 RepID=UPI00223C45D9|nr:hypothetical protein [Brachybacterium sp. Z12]
MSSRTTGIPASAWLRPALLLVGGLLLTALLFLAGQKIASVAVAIFSVFMAYWTSPLRSGPHIPLTEARTQRADTAIILWAPGNPLSARLQAAIRGPREDVAWVNVFRDPHAQEVLASHGGTGALPLVMVGGQTMINATAGGVLDLQETVRRGQADGGSDTDR